MSNPVFERGMHEVITTVTQLVGWRDVAASGGKVFDEHHFVAEKRCGHFTVRIIKAADGTNIIPDVETSNRLVGAVELMWTQRGGENMGAPWGSIDFHLQSDGKVKLNFGAVKEDEEDIQTEYLQTVHDAREKLYEELFGGQFPGLITKLRHLFGVWPLGGLVDFKAPNIAGDYHVHSSFGLSNPDMPGTVAAKVIKRENGKSSTMLGPKDIVLPPRVGLAGYGYELLIITKAQEDWTKYLMQWAVDKELQTDVNFLAHVEGAGGLTVENVPLGPHQWGNILIAVPQGPWPKSGVLPNGTVRFLVMTVITKEEMKFAMKKGRPALLRQLHEMDVGQVSDLDRLCPAGEDQTEGKGVFSWCIE